MTTVTSDRTSIAGTGPLTVLPSTYGHLRTLSVSGIQLNLDGMSVTVRGQTLPLPYKEFQVLQLLMDNAGRLLTRRQILDRCWEPGYVDAANSVDVYVGRLRRKIEPTPHRPVHIRAVRSVGYIFDLLS